MKRIRALLFDLDDTLLVANAQEAVVGACEQVAAMYPELEAARLIEANSAAWRRYWPEVEGKWTLGVLDGASVRFEAWRRTLRLYGSGDESVAQRAAMIHGQLANRGHRLFDDAGEILTAAARARVPLALITNGASDDQREKLRAVGIERWFGGIVISGEVGAAKPDAEVFAIALRTLRVGPEGAWHVGDNLAADVAGAKAAGLASIWVNRTGRVRGEHEPAPDLEIRSLSELTAWLP